MSELIEQIERDEELKRFIEINLDLFKVLSKVQYGTLDTDIKEGKILTNNKRVKITR